MTFQPYFYFYFFFWIDANSSDGEIDSNGSSSPCSKRQRTDDNFDACDFVRESVTDEAVDQMSMGATDDDYEFATHGSLFRQKFWFKLRLAILILTEFSLLKTVVKVKRSGQIIDVTSLWEMEGGAVSVSSADGSKEQFNFGRMDSIKA